MSAVKPWTDEEDAQLRRLWEQRKPLLTAAQIGALLGRPKNSIAGRRLRLRLPERGSPIGRDGTSARAAMRRRSAALARSHKAKPPVPRLLQLVSAPSAPPRQGQTPPAAVSSLPRPAAPLSPHRECRWIEGEAHGAESAFCCAPVVPGYSWCAAHRKRVLVPRQVAA